MDLDWEREFDNQWNFVYFGYSIPLARGFAYVLSLSTNIVRTINFEEIYHFDPLQRLTFQVGRTPTYKFGINGMFSTVRLNLDA